MRATTGHAAGSLYKRWRRQQWRGRPGPFLRPNSPPCAASPSSPSPSVPIHPLLTAGTRTYHQHLFFHRSPSKMTLCKASTLILFAASFVAMLTMSVLPSAGAAAGSDKTVNQGVALASMLLRDAPPSTAAELAKANSKCTKQAALCNKSPLSISIVHQLRACLACDNTCRLAFEMSMDLVRPALEMRRLNDLLDMCGLKWRDLTDVTPPWAWATERRPREGVQYEQRQQRPDRAASELFKSAT